MTEFTKDNISAWRIWGEPPGYVEESLDEIERLQARVQELETQLKSKDIIINNQQGRLNYYATKDLLGGKNEHG